VAFVQKLGYEIFELLPLEKFAVRCLRLRDRRRGCCCGYIVVVSVFGGQLERCALMPELEELAHKQQINQHLLKLRCREPVDVVCCLEVPSWLPQGSDAPRLVVVVCIGGTQQLQLILRFAAQVLILVLVLVLLVQQPLFEPLFALDRGACADPTTEERSQIPLEDPTLPRRVPHAVSSAQRLHALGKRRPGCQAIAEL
jgi:hypothetical protein